MTISTHRAVLITGIIAILLLLPALTFAANSTKTVYRINDTTNLYVLPFTLTHDRYTVVAPTTAQRDTTGSTTLTYTLKTPEGLRVKDGRSVAALTRNNVTGASVLYVLYEKSSSSSRANTLSVTAFPFSLVSGKGTSTTQFAPHELRQFTLSDTKVQRIVDSE
jgi:hypothetical protein